MEIILLAVGKLRPCYRQACDEYQKRLSRYASVSEIEIRESRRTGSPAETNLDESRLIESKLPARATVIALSRQGSPWSSPELARRLERWQLEARPLALAIGGSTGLDQDFIARCQHAWSLGPLTLPHELARVVVWEQFYRAFTILRGEPYHKGRR